MEILNQQAENVCLEPQPPQQIAPMAARIFRGMFGITAGRLWSSEGNTLYRPPHLHPAKHPTLGEVRQRLIGGGKYLGCGLGNKW